MTRILVLFFWGRVGYDPTWLGESVTRIKDVPWIILGPSLSTFD